MKKKPHKKIETENIDNIEKDSITEFEGPRDILAENGFIFLNGSINLDSVDDVIKRLWMYELIPNFQQSIKLVINSCVFCSGLSNQ